MNLYIKEETHIEASLDNNWIGFYEFSFEKKIVVEVFNSEGGELEYTEILETDSNGYAFFKNTNKDGDPYIELEPGTYIPIRYENNNINDYLIMSDIALNDIDFDADIIKGTSSPGTEVQVNVYPDDYPEWDIADEFGNWEINLTGSFDITEEMWFTARTFDEDGDETVVEYRKH